MEILRGNQPRLKAALDWNKFPYYASGVKEKIIRCFRPESERRLDNETQLSIAQLDYADDSILHSKNIEVIIKSCRRK